MSRDKINRLPIYLNHIAEGIVRIYKYIEDVSELDFIQNDLVQDAVIRNFEIIGEASKRIVEEYPEFVEAHSEIP